MTLMSGVTNRGLIRMAELATWCAPPLVIPGLRYLQDPPETRRRLFIRDFSTYSLGAGVYFAAKAVGIRLLKPLIKDMARRQLGGLLIGLAANLAFAGLAAVPLSRLVDRHLPKGRPTPASTPTLPAFSGRAPGRAMGKPGRPAGLLHRNRTGAFDVFQRV